MKTFTRKQFDKAFPDTESCFNWLIKHRYPNGIECPSCKAIGKCHKLVDRPVYECVCGNQISPLANSIFHKSSTPLKIWFQAIYQMSSTRTGISAKQIQRETGVTYKTAWRMFKQIRTLMNEQPVTTSDGFRSLVTRGIGGVHHTVHPKYLQSYVNEYSFRYNHRNDKTSMFYVILNQI